MKKMAHTSMEDQYLEILRELLCSESSPCSTNRTGIQARRTFGRMIKFPLGDGFPLLTTKRVFWRGVFEELMWFLRGQTDASILQSKGVHIWDGNTSREYLDSRGLQRYPEGDAGPIYGFQWRHFGASYNSSEGAPPRGTDQLAYVCGEILKNPPHSRRIVMSAWNPPDLDDMALPPCHMGVQFFVQDGRRLSVSVWCRSQDVFLGTPFNIASYALLCHIVAHACGGLEVGDVVVFMGDVHLYETHVDAALVQLQRPPRPLPRLRITRSERPSQDVDSIVRWIETLEFADVELVGYDPHPGIKASMVV
jgi:thymidylate synthase